MKWPSKKGAWSASRDPLNFGTFVVSSCKAVKATDFQYDMHVSRDSPDSPDMNPLKFLEKGASVKIHLALSPAASSFYIYAFYFFIFYFLILL